MVKASWRYFKAVFSISATFIGTVVGAGFASGQEIYQFFSVYGLQGFAGLFLAIGLMGWATNRVFEIGLTLQTYSYRDILQYLLGRRIAPVADFFFLFFFLLLTGVMFAGSGAVFQETGLGYPLGVFLTLGVLLGVLYRGLPGLIEVNVVVIPLMFLACFLVTGHAVLKPAVRSLEITVGYKWIVSAIQFASYNLMLALPVLLALAKDIPDRKLLRTGSWLGSVFLGFLALLIHGSLLAHREFVQNSALPMVGLANRIGHCFFWGYALVLWGEMLTTLLANVYGLGQRLSAWSGWTFRKWLLVLGILGVVIAQMGFVKLIVVFYPIYGFLSMILLIALFLRTGVHDEVKRQAIPKNESHKVKTNT